MRDGDKPQSDSPVEAALAEYLERVDRQESIDPEQFIAQHPQVAEELRRYLSDLEVVRRNMAGNRPSAAGTGDSACSPAGGARLPRTFGAYLLLEKLGAGGMGEVFKAEHRHMERLVAVKMLHPRAFDSPEAAERFHREVKAAAKLAHPNVVTAHDAGEVDGVRYLAMEYVDGGDLQELVLRHGPLAVAQAVNYLVQAARGLEFAHRKKVIHRDVKPANLLVDREGAIKLLDLGLARLESPASGLAPTGSGSLTEFGQIMGTIDFMAPEQALDTRRAGVPADIYSLGCTLFFLLTGRTIYIGDTPMEKIIAHREQPIPSLTSVRRDVPPLLDAVFQRMVAKRPEQRPASMSEVIAQLEASLPEAVQSSARWPYPAEEASAGASSQPSPSIVPTTPTAQDSSLNAAPSAQPTSDWKPAVEANPQPRRWRAIFVAAVLVGLLAVAAGAIVFQMQTGDGTLVLRVSEPGSRVAVLDEQGNVEITRQGEPGVLRIAVDPGKHRLKVEKDGFQFFAQEFTIESRGVKEIEARLEPLPPPMIPPAVAASSSSAATDVPKLPPPSAEPWPGIIPKPTTMPGIGRWQVSFASHSAPGKRVAWVPGGARLAVAHLSGEIRIYDSADDFRLCAVMVGHRGLVADLRWSPNGKLLASAGWDGTIRIWEASGAPRSVIIANEGARVNSLSWSPDGGQLACAGWWDEVRVWGVDGVQGMALKAPGSSICSVAWRPDGKLIAAGCIDGKILSWSSDGVPGPTLSGHNAPVAIEWNPQGDRLASGSWDKTVRIWNADLESSPILRGHENRVLSLAWSPDGTQLVSGDDSGGIRLWTAAGEAGPTIRTRGEMVGGLAWSPDSQLVAGVDGVGLQIFRGDGPEIRSISWAGYGLDSLAWNPRSGQLAACPGVVRIWDRDGRSNRAVLIAYARCLAWSPDGTRLATGDNEGVIRLWQEDGKPGPVLKAHTGAVRRLAWSSDGNSLASGGDDKTVRTWSNDGSALQVLEGHASWVGAVAWSAEGKLASNIADGTVRLSDAADNAGQVLKNAIGTARLTAWNPTRPLLAWANPNNSLRLWDSQAERFMDLRGHTGQVRCLAWSPDGKRLATGGDDLTVRLWSEDGRQEETFKGENSLIESVAWSGDGTQIATGTIQGVVLVRDAETGEPQWLALALSEGNSVTFGAAGEVLHGDPTVIERELIYLVETPTGAAEILKPTEFRRRVAAAAAQQGQPIPAIAKLPGERISLPPAAAQPGDQSEISLAEMLTSGEWEWAPPENLGPVVNSTHWERDPEVSRDGLALMFTSSRPGGMGKSDLWISDRPSIDASWSPPRNLGAPINSEKNESRSSLSADGSTLVFSSEDRPGKGSSDLWFSTRSAKDAPWAAPVNFEFNTSDWEAGPSLSADGLSLYFDKGNGLAVSHKKSLDDAWSPPALLDAAINPTKAQLTGPWLTEDGLVLLYCAGDETCHLWMSSRASQADPWSPPTKFDITSPKIAISPSYCPAEQTLYFASDRADGYGRADLWKSRLVRRQAAAPPPLAVAPFTAEEARQHQARWAKHLGVPVEYENSIGMKFVLIPPGEFDMGSTEAEVAKLLEQAKTTKLWRWYNQRLSIEAPRHRVRITKPFWLGAYEVTRGQFRRFVDVRGYKTEAERDGNGGIEMVDGQWKQDPSYVWDRAPGFEQSDDYPVVNVTYSDLTAFCEWLSQREGAASHLPTEAQWEYACRAGTTTMWYSGDDEGTLSAHGWFTDNSEWRPHPVGGKSPNAWGLYDMHGSVWEWCRDGAGQYSATSPKDDPIGPLTSLDRVLRGGSWASYPSFGRASFRNGCTPDYRHATNGFRVARTIETPSPLSEPANDPADAGRPLTAPAPAVDLPTESHLPSSAQPSPQPSPPPSAQNPLPVVGAREPTL